MGFDKDTEAQDSEFGAFFCKSAITCFVSIIKKKITEDKLIFSPIQGSYNHIATQILKKYKDSLSNRYIRDIRVGTPVFANLVNFKCSAQYQQREEQSHDDINISDFIEELLKNHDIVNTFIEKATYLVTDKKQRELNRSNLQQIIKLFLYIGLSASVGFSLAFFTFTTMLIYNSTIGTLKTFVMKLGLIESQPISFVFFYFTWSALNFINPTAALFFFTTTGIASVINVISFVAVQLFDYFIEDQDWYLYSNYVEEYKEKFISMIMPKGDIEVDNTVSPTI